MATLYLRRYIIVARADVAAAANLAANQADTNDGGDGSKTFTVGLSASGAAPAQAFICNWALKAPQAVAIRTRLQERGATVAETTPVPAGQTPASNRFAVFDVINDGWDPEAVLAACGLKRVEVR